MYLLNFSQTIKFGCLILRYVMKLLRKMFSYINVSKFDKFVKRNWK